MKLAQMIKLTQKILDQHKPAEPVLLLYDGKTWDGKDVTPLPSQAGLNIRFLPEVPNPYPDPDEECGEKKYPLKLHV